MEDKPQVRKQYYTRIMDFYRFNPVYIPFLNPVIRQLQARKADRHFREITAMARGRESEIAGWYRSHRFFFGFGMYRSGTTFLANFLNSNVRDAIILHETNVNDYWNYAKAIHSEKLAEEYIADYRLYEIYFRISPYTFKTYGEINPFLRRHCPAISKLFPEAKLFQIVRHPGAVIRSLMSREQLGFKDPMKKVIFPSKEDPFAEEWKHWGRFEKFCWMWRTDNAMLRQYCSHAVKFELLRKDYDYFLEKVLQPLDLEMDADTWKAGVSVVNNNSPRYTFPAYADWNSDQKRFLEEMCGAEMAHYGY